MKRTLLGLVCSLVLSGWAGADTPAPVQVIPVAALPLKLQVKQVVPYAQDADLQIMCVFQHKPAGDQLLEAVADFDTKVSGMISGLRNSGDFQGAELETVVFTPAAGAVAPRQIMLIGLGPEETLSLEKMRRVGRVAAREALRLKATRVAYASALRDQGNNVLDTGDVAGAVVTGLLEAYRAEKKLQDQGRSPQASIDEWTMEAGPAFFAGTVKSVQQAVSSSKP